ncbi:MAG: SUMF1/EgtB/PvdO family nonheme iron enzyme [Phycisphaerae bacterium]|nr:SUMF1/EgtB/PvdO family nonheme iron enzyme [Phycisphaerae bacterium]
MRQIICAKGFLVAAVILTSTGLATGPVSGFEMDMKLVPAGGEPNGPAYDFWMGRCEVTLAQYFTFLNDAEANQGNERGAYMAFNTTNGDIGLMDGTSADGIFDISDCNSIFPYAPHYRVAYDANQPLGSRYVYDPNEADYPIAGASWIGAVKFCNWLTIEMGLDPSQRCYAEGVSVADWRPVTIAKADWAVRDLDQAERQSLVDLYVGFRLPMDDVGLQSGYIDGLPSAYNEWYKAAAYDANAPATVRIGANGESVPPYHWKYGYGTDEPDLTKANFLIYDANFPGGVDPNCVRFPTPVGTYAPSNGNPWGIDDLSGNVYEWGQDYSNSIIDPTRHATRSRSFDSGEPASAFRHYRIVTNGTFFVGFRVVQCGGYVLDLEIVNPSSGTLDVEPNRPVYPAGEVVTLTAVPAEGRSIKWYLFDPNYPGDLNHAAADANLVLELSMTRDWEVQARFTCGNGVPQTLPLLAVGLLALGIISRRGRGPAWLLRTTRRLRRDS